LLLFIYEISGLKKFFSKGKSKNAKKRDKKREKYFLRLSNGHQKKVINAVGALCVLNGKQDPFAAVIKMGNILTDDIKEDVLKSHLLYPFILGKWFQDELTDSEVDDCFHKSKHQNNKNTKQCILENGNVVKHESSHVDKKTFLFSVFNSQNIKIHNFFLDVVGKRNISIESINPLGNNCVVVLYDVGMVTPWGGLLSPYKIHFKNLKDESCSWNVKSCKGYIFIQDKYFVLYSNFLELRGIRIYNIQGKEVFSYQFLDFVIGIKTKSNNSSDSVIMQLDQASNDKIYLKYTCYHPSLSFNGIVDLVRSKKPKSGQEDFSSRFV